MFTLWVFKTVLTIDEHDTKCTFHKNKYIQCIKKYARHTHDCVISVNIVLLIGAVIISIIFKLLICLLQNKKIYTNKHVYVENMF